MTATEIAQCPPGSVILLCIPRESQEETIERAAADAAPLLEPSGLCRGRIVSMKMSGGTDPNAFDSLALLIRRLIAAAGYSSHFDGLLLLDISDLNRNRDTERLKALGELLTMPDGLASCCRTVIYGPSSEEDMLRTAGPLDLSGTLRLGMLEEDSTQSLNRALQATCISFSSARTEKWIRSSIDRLCGQRGFDCVRYLRSAADSTSRITADSLQRMQDDPYSYYNRMLNAKETSRRSRKIGFGE